MSRLFSFLFWACLLAAMAVAGYDVYLHQATEKSDFSFSALGFILGEYVPNLLLALSEGASPGVWQVLDSLLSYPAFAVMLGLAVFFKLLAVILGSFSKKAKHAQAWR